MDQAASLRRMAVRRRSCAVAVLSGKGGVGKTNVALSLSLVAARALQKVLLWDADFSLANCDVLMDLAPRFTIHDLLGKDVRLDDAVVRGPGGLWVLPAASGVREPVGEGPEGRRALRELLEGLAREYELVVIDSAAGIGESVISLALRADIILLTTSPEVPAVADAYATLKVLCQAGRSKGIELLVNMASHRAEAEKIGSRMRHVAARFLGAELELAGWIPADPHVPQAVGMRRPFVLCYPDCPAARAVEAVWDRIGAASAVTAGGVR